MCGKPYGHTAILQLNQDDSLARGSRRRRKWRRVSGIVTRLPRRGRPRRGSESSSTEMSKPDNILYSRTLTDLGIYRDNGERSTVSGKEDISPLRRGITLVVAWIVALIVVGISLVSLTPHVDSRC
jgi:hypothetical protein